MQKKESWVKFRHKVITTLLRPLFRPFVAWKYGIKMERFPAQGKRPYLIVMNHQTAYDQFFVAMTFDRPVYYIASEDLFSMGWISGLIRYLVAPIPIKKQTTDLQAVKNCIQVAREGGTICLAPEGHRTFHGKTVYIKPGIGSLAKKLGLPIAIFRIEGGYGVQPRWSDVVRRGGMRSYVKRVIEPEEFKSMTGDELFRLIETELYVDEARITGEYPHKKNAEFLERLVYTCPKCGLSTFESHDDLIRCTKCGMTVRHLPTKVLEGVDCDFPYRFVSDWFEGQNDYVNSLDVTAMTEHPLYEEQAQFSRVYANKRKELLNKQAVVRLYGDRITVGDRTFGFEETSTVTVLGKNKLNIYVGKEIYQLKGNRRFNAVKYTNFHHRYKNIKAGDANEQFLGF